MANWNPIAAAKIFINERIIESEKLLHQTQPPDDNDNWKEFSCKTKTPKKVIIFSNVLQFLGKI